MSDELMQFEGYKVDWILKHPGSIPVEEIEESPYPRWVKPGILLGSAIASLLSGVHTMLVVYNGIPLSPMVDEIMRQWVARGSFVVYEFGMFASAFLMSSESTRPLARRILWVIFTTLIITNLYSVFQTYGFDLENNPAGAGVTALFSLVPVIAYGLGKFYVSVIVNERAAVRRSKESKREADKKLDAQILRDYEKYVKLHEKPVKSSETNEVHEIFHETGEKPKRRVKLHEVAREIHENGDENLSVGEMMSKYGISQGSTTKVREILKSQNGLVQ